MSIQTEHTHRALPEARVEQGTGTLPSAVTFFMTRQQRVELLHTLALLSENRTQALLIATGMQDSGEGAQQ